MTLKKRTGKHFPGHFKNIKERTETLRTAPNPNMTIGKFSLITINYYWGFWAASIVDLKCDISVLFREIELKLVSSTQRERIDISKVTSILYEI